MLSVDRFGSVGQVWGGVVLQSSTHYFLQDRDPFGPPVLMNRCSETIYSFLLRVSVIEAKSLVRRELWSQEARRTRSGIIRDAQTK
ncbi:hypothetical protein E2C01_066693 [Portunus trituberculatus]|uniref:Uncharacterized protein n=1 Tax=Portunus trituberculatus TaxID=210409 RepID=A0A5B7HUI4_PORTR|nr:hypothetical protein [Portunus trituberculatus]